MESEFKEEVTVSEILPINHKEYATYSIREFLPNMIDGLKLVYRRVLWALGTNANKQKCIKLIGDTITTTHPHGDASVYSGIIRLCQPFSQCLPLVASEANVGSYGGARPAAPRYLDLNRSEFACDLFFNHVNTKTFSYLPNELNNGVEPACFIPVIPTALLIGATSIGVGFRSSIPFYNFVGVCNLAIDYVKKRKDLLFHPKDHYREFTQHLIPDFPTYSLIRNGDALIEKYNNGKFSAPIVTDGCTDVFPGKIVLKSIPYGFTFQQVLDKLKEELAKPSFISSNVNSVDNLMAAVDIGDIKITLKRGVNVFDILDEMKRQLGFTKAFTPIWNFSDNNGTVYNLEPFQLIERWYIERYRSILGDLKITQRELNTLQREIEAKVIVVDHTDDVTKISSTSTNRAEAVLRLVDRFKEFRLTPLQAEYILSLNLGQLTREGKDKLLQDLEVVKQKIKANVEKFQDVDAIIIEDIERIRDKYANKIVRRCALPDYIGCIHIGNNGVVQVRSLQELAHQLRRWYNENPSIEMYPEGKSYHVSYLENKGYTEDEMCFPKTFKAQAMKTSKFKPTGTLILNGGQIYRTEFMARPNKGQYIPITSEYTGVDKKNIFHVYNAADVPKRQSLSSLGIMTDVKFISSVKAAPAIVIYHDVAVPNEVHIVKVNDGERLPISLLSKAEVTHIFRPQDQIAFTVDDKFLNRCTLKHLYFKDAESILSGDKHVTLYLNKRTTSNRKNLVEIIKGIELYGVVHMNKVKDVYEFI